MWSLITCLRKAKYFDEYYDYAKESNLFAEGGFPSPDEAYSAFDIQYHDKMVDVWNHEVTIFHELWNQWTTKKEAKEEIASLVPQLIGSFKKLVEVSTVGVSITRQRYEEGHDEINAILVAQLELALTKEVADHEVITPVRSALEKVFVPAAKHIQVPTTLYEDPKKVVSLLRSRD